MVGVLSLSVVLVIRCDRNARVRLFDSQLKYLYIYCSIFERFDNLDLTSLHVRHFWFGY